MLNDIDAKSVQYQQIPVTLKALFMYRTGHSKNVHATLWCRD